jgi:[ribosomal protein S5]-alanine N-acetyltransferase
MKKENLAHGRHPTKSTPLMNLLEVKLQTKRLLLEPVTGKYAEQIFAEYREPVIQYMNHGAPESLDVLQQRIADRKLDMEKGIQLFMAVLTKESGEFLGCFALEDLDKEHLEMGGWLKHSAHGNRYGQEAATAMKCWADDNLHYDYIIWPCATQNVASRKLAESLGGKVQKEYEKKTSSGSVWSFVEYWIPKRRTNS